MGTLASLTEAEAQISDDKLREDIIQRISPAHRQSAAGKALIEGLMRRKKVSVAADSSFFDSANTAPSPLTAFFGNIRIRGLPVDDTIPSRLSTE